MSWGYPISPSVLEWARVNDPEVYNKFVDQPGPSYNQVKMQYEALVKTKGSKAFWVTINFKPDVGIDDAQSVMTKISSRAFIQTYHYSFEQRGDGSPERPVGMGLHCHMLFTSDLSIGHVKKYLLNSLKSYVGNPQHVHIVLTKYYGDKLDYLKGLKWDEDKDVKVEGDKVFRLQNNLKTIYTNASLETPSSST